jgi:hypothetical protein
MKLYMFRTVPLSIISSFSPYTQQWYMSYRFADSLRAELGWNVLILLTSCLQNCMTYTIAVCPVKHSWWWTEELYETYKVSFQNKFEKLVHLVGFIIQKFQRSYVTPCFPVGIYAGFGRPHSFSMHGRIRTHHFQSNMPIGRFCG